MEIKHLLRAKLKIVRILAGEIAETRSRQAQQVWEALRVCVAGLFIIGPGRWSRATVSVVWNQALAPRTVGDFFPVVVLVRLLRLFRLRVNFTIVFCPVENQKWAELSRLQRQEVESQWVALAKLVLGKTGVKILTRERCDSERSRKNGIFSRVLSDMCHSGSVFNLFTFLYKLAPTVVSPLLLCDEFGLSARELEEAGLDTSFVTWHVRANSSYAVGRNLTDEEIVEDFLWICSNFPESRIVLLSDPSGLRAVERLLISRTNTSELLHRLIVIEQTYDFALRLIWSSTFYLQRFGGGTSVGAIWSSVPYLILMPDRWPGLPAPWATTSQLLVETHYQRLTFAQALSRESSHFVIRDSTLEKIWE